MTGLIFIALSPNLKKILSITRSHLPSRAVGSLTLLTNIVIVSNLCLVPEQPILYLGIEISSLALVIWLAVSKLDLTTYRTVEVPYKKMYLHSLFYLQLSILPFIIAGIIFMFGSGVGFYILIPGIIFSLIKSLLDIWFLTVEINR